MTLQEFYRLVDSLLSKRVNETGVEQNLTTWRESATDITKELVLSSDGVTKPYSTGNFWTKVDDKMIAYGQTPGVDSDQMALTDLVADLTFPAAYPTDVLFVNYIFSKTIALIPEQIVTDAIVSSDVKTSNFQNAQLLIFNIKASGVDVNESVTISLEYSIDGVNFIHKNIGSITSDGLYEILVESLMVTKYYKLLLTVAGTVTVSAIGMLK